jgi:putative oxidoreductase
MIVTTSTPSRTRQIFGWVASSLLCFVFLGAGSAKLAGQPMMIEQFHSFGYSVWFMYLIGLIEAGCGVLVMIPRTSRIAAVGFGCVMIGATISLLLHGPQEKIVGPVVLLALSIAVYWLRGREGRNARPARA